MRYILLLSLVALPSAAQAIGCGKGKEIAKKLFDKSRDVAEVAGCYYVQAAYGVPKALCSAATKTTRKVEKEMRNYWNRMVKNSWATIGPRALQIGKTEKGTLVGPLSRLFVSGRPVGPPTVKITVKRTGGKAKAEATICKTDSKGNLKALKTLTWPKGAGQQARSVTVKKAQGAILVVHVHAKTAARKFKYSVTAKKQ